MRNYFEIVERVLEKGVKKSDRTGTGTLSYSGMIFEHDMSTGFPLLTSKFVPFKLVASELEFFIRGFTDKQWLKDRNNHIWDEWCSPYKVPYSNDPEIQKKMMQENDLGPVYGWQWRNFNGSPYKKGIDQLKNLVQTLKTNPHDRRMIVSAWNPEQIESMALPPCHYGFQLTVEENRMNLMWNQRSVDVALGLPFNIASYALLLCLLCWETHYYKPGRLIGFLGDTHIYENHMEKIQEQIKREPYELPMIDCKDFSTIFNWEYTDAVIRNYNHHKRINYNIAV